MSFHEGHASSTIITDAAESLLKIQINRGPNTIKWKNKGQDQQNWKSTPLKSLTFFCRDTSSLVVFGLVVVILSLSLSTPTKKEDVSDTRKIDVDKFAVTNAPRQERSGKVVRPVEGGR